MEWDEANRTPGPRGTAKQCGGSAMQRECGGEREGDESEAREAGHDANMVAAAPLGSPRKAPRSAAVNPASVGPVAGRGLAALERPVICRRGHCVGIDFLVYVLAVGLRLCFRPVSPVLGLSFR